MSDHVELVCILQLFESGAALVWSVTGSEKGGGAFYNLGENPCLGIQGFHKVFLIFFKKIFFY